MTIQEKTLAKVRQLPDPLAQEVCDYIDFLMLKHDSKRSQLWAYLTESQELAEWGFDDYLRNLEDYEDRLARGEIKWQP
jgi:hypothetical protein